MDLAEFLLARINEDEAEIREGYGQEEENVFSKERLLAECDAKRRVVAKLQDERHDVIDDCWYTCAAATEDRDGGECCNDTSRGGSCDCGRDNRVNGYLELLALPYADHWDYQPEWAPQVTVR